MNFNLSICATLIAFLIGFTAFAQETKIDKAFKAASIEQLNKLINENYVFP